MAKINFLVKSCDSSHICIFSGYPYLYQTIQVLSMWALSAFCCDFLVCFLLWLPCLFSVVISLSVFYCDFLVCFLLWFPCLLSVVISLSAFCCDCLVCFLWWLHCLLSVVTSLSAFCCDFLICFLFWLPCLFSVVISLSAFCCDFLVCFLLRLPCLLSSWDFLVCQRFIHLNFVPHKATYIMILVLGIFEQHIFKTS